MAVDALENTVILYGDNQRVLATNPQFPDLETSCTTDLLNVLYQFMDILASDPKTAQLGFLLSVHGCWAVAGLKLT